MNPLLSKLKKKCFLSLKARTTAKTTKISEGFTKTFPKFMSAHFCDAIIEETVVNGRENNVKFDNLNQSELFKYF